MPTPRSSDIQRLKEREGKRRFQTHVTVTEQGWPYIEKIDSKSKPSQWTRLCLRKVISPK